jgi:MazG family protein
MRFEFEDLVAVMAHLRGPDGCPWDREQTHASLAPYLLEETHEVFEAISRSDQDALRAELGDLLLQVVFHAQMAHEAGDFDAAAVVDGLTRKLIDRHPHVFGDLRLGTAREVLERWHEIKRREAPGRGLFDGIPASLPALARAQKLLGRAAAGGIEGAARPKSAEAVAAVRRELDRVADGIGGTRAAAGESGAGDGSAASRTLGDLLFAVVALAASAGVDAEAALRGACQRFAAREAP